MGTTHAEAGGQARSGSRRLRTPGGQGNGQEMPRPRLRAGLMFGRRPKGGPSNTGIRQRPQRESARFYHGSTRGARPQGVGQELQGTGTVRPRPWRGHAVKQHGGQHRYRGPAWWKASRAAEANGNENQLRRRQRRGLHDAWTVQPAAKTSAPATARFRGFCLQDPRFFTNKHVILTTSEEREKENMFL